MWFCRYSLAVLISFTAASLASAQALPQNIKELLTTQFGFTATEVRQIESGTAVAHDIDTGSKDNIVLAGVVRLNTTPASFVAKFRDIARFQAGKGVYATGVFSKPPKMSDMAGMVTTGIEIEDVKDCKPGDCAYAMGAEGMAQLKEVVDLSAPDAQKQTLEFIKKRSIDLLTRYESEGAKAMPVYEDKEKPFASATGFKTLTSNSPILKSVAPRLGRYLDEYPAFDVKGMSSMFYWQQADFGLKPLLRCSQVAIDEAPSGAPGAAVIGTKMLFATHYFRSALELTLLVPVKDRTGKTHTYVIMSQSSVIDGLSGWKGRMIRGTAISRSRESLQKYLVSLNNKF